jgi:hypothetical protein
MLLEQALERLPDKDGGSVVVLAAGCAAPAMALLSTGDVLLRDDVVSAAVWAGGSAAAVVEAGSGFSLMVATAGGAIRVEVEHAATRHAGALTVIEGPITRLRLTSEPPWAPDLCFRLANGDVAAASAFVAFWASVREWLAAGAEPPSPRVPSS